MYIGGGRDVALQNVIVCLLGWSVIYVYDVLMGVLRGGAEFAQLVLFRFWHKLSLNRLTKRR